MLINTFTLIDAFNQYWTVRDNMDKRSLTASMGLYFYLVKVWNASGRLNIFRHQNNLIMAQLGISKPTLINQRNILKQSGLIEFFSKGKGDSNISYRIIDVVSSKKILLPKEEKLKNFTSGFTSDFTSDFIHKQSTEKELFVFVNKEVKNFNYLQELFSQDAGLKLNWAQKFHPPEKFRDGVEQWMIQNNGSNYGDFAQARKHFLFWMPNYNKEKPIKNGTQTDGGSIKQNGFGKKTGGTISDLQSLKRSTAAAEPGRADGDSSQHEWESPEIIE